MVADLISQICITSLKSLAPVQVPVDGQPSEESASSMEQAGQGHSSAGTFNKDSHDQ